MNNLTTAIKVEPRREIPVYTVSEHLFKKPTNTAAEKVRIEVYYLVDMHIGNLAKVAIHRRLQSYRGSFHD